jgi:hypothetical protein
MHRYYDIHVFSILTGWKQTTHVRLAHMVESIFMYDRHVCRNKNARLLRSQNIAQ